MHWWHFQFFFKPPVKWLKAPKTTPTVFSFESIQKSPAIVKLKAVCLGHDLMCHQRGNHFKNLSSWYIAALHTLHSLDSKTINKIMLVAEFDCWFPVSICCRWCGWYCSCPALPVPCFVSPATAPSADGVPFRWAQCCYAMCGPPCSPSPHH